MSLIAMDFKTVSNEHRPHREGVSPLFGLGMTSLNDPDVFPPSCVFTNGSGLLSPLPDPDPHKNVGYIGSKLYPSFSRRWLDSTSSSHYFYKYLGKWNENCLLPPSRHGWWLKPAQAATEPCFMETREVWSPPEFYRLNPTNKAGWSF